MSRSVGCRRRIQAVCLAALAGLVATGCQTYKDQNRVISHWRQNNLTNAVAEATRMADRNAQGKDAIIWRLEQGAVLRAAGKYVESNTAFDKAQARIDQYARAAKVSVSSEAVALLSNQATLPYEGRTYDGIMLNTYKALNYLQLGEPDKARVELIRAYQRQQDAVEDNKKRIEKTQAAAAKNKDKKTMDKAEQDPKFKAKVQGAYTNLNTLKVYADYVNPFTVYLDGLFFMANAADASDLERAHKSFERVVEFNPDNNYVKQDLATVDGMMESKPLTPTTYVIFETGCAPVRDQTRIDIPIIVAKVSYVGAAFPTLKPQDNYLSSLTVTASSPQAIANASAPSTNGSVATPTAGDTNTTVSTSAPSTNATPVVASNPPSPAGDATAGGTSATTSPIASMDSVIGLDFKNEMPLVITKTIAATVAKAVAAYAINQTANQQDALLGLFAQISTAVYQMAVNIADERTWTTLPKEFQVCRFPTPSDRKIELGASGTGQRIPVTIGDGTLNIVYVKSITATGPLLVTQMKLK
jgi:uncharacterized protein